MTSTIISPLIEQQPGDFFGLPVFCLDSNNYIVATGQQAEVTARQVAKECLTDVNPNLILKYSCLSPADVAIQLIRYIQGGCCDEEQRILAAVVKDLDGLADEAVRTQGRACFLGMWGQGIEYPLVQFPQLQQQAILAAISAIDERDVYLYRF
uniref:hypothetical protein n=1 Tax=Trichocoleus desertorum TaxID=1481672 RepID=UPI0025B4D14A|nr:hypothetical protein [Trichocoleus desertorum]